MKILLIEDDPVQAESLASAISNSFEVVLLETRATVADVESYLQDLKTEPPSLIILDGIIPFSRPSPNAFRMGNEATIRSPYDGGRECLRMLASNRLTATVPVIVYTVLDREHVLSKEQKAHPHLLHVKKRGDAEELMIYIRSVMLGEPQERVKNLTSRFAGAVEAKPGWFGISVDLKKLFDKRDDPG